MTEQLQLILFNIFALVAVVSALYVVISNNPVRSALALVLVFFATAGIWILYQVEFLALILILVYVGAVMTLFLFVVMMINTDVEQTPRSIIFYGPLSLFIIATIVGLVLMVAPKTLLFKKTVSVAATHLSNSEALGMVLYTKYVYAFELASALLLVAIVAAIALAHRKISRSRKQAVMKQVLTTKESRLRVLPMASVKDE